MRCFSLLPALFIAALFIAALFMNQQSVGAQERQFTLELNNARDTDGGCRLSFIAFNGTGVALDKTSYEAVVFDSDGLVVQFLILEFGSLPANKTRVVQFQLAGQTCGSISRLLINNVAECVSNQEASNVCLDLLKTSARTEISFGV